MEISAFQLKVRVWKKPNDQVYIAGWSAISPRPALSCQPHS
jgi:hypothetical protein